MIITDSIKSYGIFLALVFAISSYSQKVEATVSRMVFFGDSLSDPGNHYAAYGQLSVTPYIPVPDFPYAVDGYHFSNARTWAERITTKLMIKDSGQAALVNPGVNTNYAVGRARARSGAPIFSDFDLSIQVNRFLNDFNGIADPNAVYAIWIGSNDLSDALFALQYDPTGATSQAILSDALNAIAINMQTLLYSGANKFLILNLPNPASTPFVRSLGAQAQSAATLLTGLFNQNLNQIIAGFQAIPGVQVVSMDTEALFNSVLAYPKEYKLSNVIDSCLKFGVLNKAICNTPDKYLFWDGIHPTTVGHEIIALEAKEVLKNF